MTSNPPNEVVKFLKELRRFTRPTLRGFLRSRAIKIWLWFRPLRTTFGTHCIEEGDIIEISGTVNDQAPRRVVSKTGSTLTFDDGSTATLT